MKKKKSQVAAYIIIISSSSSSCTETPRYAEEAAQMLLRALTSWICFKHTYICLADNFSSLLLFLLFLTMFMTSKENYCEQSQSHVELWPCYRFWQSIICTAVTSLSGYTWTSFKPSLWLTGNSCGNREIGADYQIHPKPKQIFEMFPTLSCVLQELQLKLVQLYLHGIWTYTRASTARFYACICTLNKQDDTVIESLCSARKS